MKFGIEKRAYRKSILYKIRLLIFFLCFIIIFYSGSALLNGWKNYKQALELITLEGITDSFSQALKSFMFERGRTNVILSAASPVSKENLDFVQERRTDADEYFEKGFVLMEGLYKREVELLRFDYNQIQNLRKKMDEQMSKERSQRDADSPNVWFSACTSYINSVDSTLKRINEPHFDSVIGRYIELIINTLRFRSITGHESSLFTAAISGSAMLSDEEYSDLLSLRGESKQLWYDIRNSIDMLNSKELSNAATTVQETYYNNFRSNQDRLLELAKNEQLYAGAQTEIANLSVPALNSILLLADQALEEINQENQNSMQTGYRHFILGLLQVLGGVLIIIFIPVYLKKKLIRPLNIIVSTLGELSAGNTDIAVEYVHRSDEIGKLAQGVELLQGSFIKEQDLSKELQDVIVKLEDLSIKDPLTGLYNRRYVMERLHEFVERFNKEKTMFSIIICDIDYFKKVNDTYGHVCGDYVLTSIASLISDHCRKGDIPCRWGGEEFFIVLPKTDKYEAGVLAERIRVKLENKVLTCHDELSVTMTFGVSEYMESLGIQGNIQNADMALLQGKQQGRNRVVVH